MSLYLPLFFTFSGTLTWKICISRFLTKELPFTFLVAQICWQWIPSAFACWNSFYFVLFLKTTFFLYSILDWLFFFSFHTLKLPLSYLMAWIISAKKLCINLTFVPLYLIPSFPHSSHPYHYSVLLSWLSRKESACSAGAIGYMGSIPGSGRSPGGGHGNPLQYSCLENLHEQRSLVGYNL